MSQIGKIFLLLACMLSSNSLAQEIPPASEIKNEHVEIKIYLPDTEKGYYQGTRFDWSGVIGSLKYRGHQYFDPWFDVDDPTVHDAISGPVEAFAPIGFEAAKPGENFLVVGVGILRKPTDEPYQFATTYENVNSGKWKVRQKRDRIEFIQTLAGMDGYAYEYHKTVRLLKGKPEMVLEHRLKNTGKKLIETTVYNHNFFVIDREPTGPNIVTTFPYVVQGEGRGFGEIIAIQDTALIFKRNLKEGESVYTAGLQGFGTGPEDYDIRIENKKSGAGVRITSDQPLLKLPYWACVTTACPEPYIQVKVLPDQSFTWKIIYAFYIL